MLQELLLRICRWIRWVLVKEQVLGVRITGTEQAVRAFLVQHPLEPQNTSRKGNQVSIDVLMRSTSLLRFWYLEVSSEVVYNASALARERSAEVGKGNRFEGNRIPQGLGIKPARKVPR